MNSEHLQKKLESIRVRSLNENERELVWKQVSFGMAGRSLSTRSFLSHISLFKKLTAVTLIFSMTAGSAFAADNARPGDFLFPLDRAIEKLHLSVVPAEKKSELKVTFALERVAEVKDILKEVSDEQKSETAKKIAITPIKEIGVASSTDTDPTPTQDTSSSTTPAITTIDSNLEKSESKNITPTTSLSEVVTQEKEMILSDLSTEKKERIELALSTALSFLGEVKGELSEEGNDAGVSHVDLMIDELNSEMTTLPENITFEIDLSSKKKGVRFEVTSDDNERPKVHIEVPQKQESDATATSSNEVESVQPSDDLKKVSTSKLEISNGDLTITKPEEPRGEQPSENTPNEESATSSSESEETTTSEATGTSTKSDEAVETSDERGTTTVKFIFKKIPEDFEVFIIDQNADIHKLLENYLDDGKKN